MDVGVIITSTSPWSGPIWIVPKKFNQTGKQKWRILIDFRKPTPTTHRTKLVSAYYFNILDLATEFDQIEIDKNDICKLHISL